MSDPTPLRRRLGAAALVAAGVLVAASLALKVVDTEEPRALLEAIAAAPDRFAAGTLLQLAAAACLLAALPVFLWLLRGRGGRLGAAAIGLLYASTLGNVGDAGASAYQWAAATDGVSAADVALVERAQESAAGVAVSLLVLVGLLGFPLLAAALYRARTTPPAVPALIAAAFVSFFFPIPELVGGLLLVAAFGLVARQLVDEREAVRLTYSYIGIYSRHGTSSDHGGRVQRGGRAPAAADPRRSSPAASGP